MSLITLLVFSLAWGGLVWLIAALALPETASDRRWPAVFLSLIAALVLPSLLAGLGPALPAAGSRGVLLLAGGADLGLAKVAESVQRLSAGSNGQGMALAIQAVTVLYCAGLLLHLFLGLRARRFLARCVENARPLAGVRSRWPVLETDRPVVPFAIGGLRPAIVLPAELVRRLPEEDVAMIVAHEENHQRHGDPGVACTLTIVVALFWFNPFLRSLVGRWRHACELRADASVLNGAQSDTRRRYAGALLSAMRLAAESGPTLSVSFTSRSLRSQKMRLSAIMNDRFEKSGPGSNGLAAAFGLCLLTLTGFAAALSASSMDAGAAEGDGLQSIVPGGRLAVPYGVIRKVRGFHRGVDIAAPKGAPIIAPGDARVLQATDRYPRYGKTVVLQFAGGLSAWFTHLDAYSVRYGDRISKGQRFATVGATGSAKVPHVHLEAYQEPGHKRIDPASVWNGLRP